MHFCNTATQNSGTFCKVFSLTWLTMFGVTSQIPRLGPTRPRPWQHVSRSDPESFSQHRDFDPQARSLIRLQRPLYGHLTDCQERSSSFNADWCLVGLISISRYPLSILVLTLCQLAMMLYCGYRRLVLSVPRWMTVCDERSLQQNILPTYPRYRRSYITFPGFHSSFTTV